MPGLNHVSRGEAPLVLALSPAVTLTKVSVGPMDNNAYLLESAGARVLIDAAADPDTLLALVGEGELDTIVTTHQHHDHVGALAELARTGARLVAGAPDAESIATQTGVPAPDGVWDGDTVPLGPEHLDVIGLVGHTAGSVTLAYRGPDGPTHLFTGDSLFPGGVGNTRTPGDFTSLIEDVEGKIFAVYDDDTVVHPGHGDDTTLGAERPHLAEWRARGW